MADEPLQWASGGKNLADVVLAFIDLNDRNHSTQERDDAILAMVNALPAVTRSDVDLEGDVVPGLQANAPRAVTRRGVVGGTEG